MIQGFKCSFCNYFHMLDSEVIAHESTCKRNPYLKGCATCRSCEQWFRDSKPSCNKGLRIPEELNTNCPEWEQRA